MCTKQALRDSPKNTRGLCFLAGFAFFAFAACASALRFFPASAFAACCICCSWSFAAARRSLRAASTTTIFSRKAVRSLIVSSRR